MLRNLTSRRLHTLHASFHLPTELKFHKNYIETLPELEFNVLYNSVFNSMVEDEKEREECEELLGSLRKNTRQPLKIPKIPENIAEFEQRNAFIGIEEKEYKAKLSDNIISQENRFNEICSMKYRKPGNRGKKYDEDEFFAFCEGAFADLESLFFVESDKKAAFYPSDITILKVTDAFFQPLRANFAQTGSIRTKDFSITPTLTCCPRLLPTWDSLVCHMLRNMLFIYTYSNFFERPPSFAETERSDIFTVYARIFEWEARQMGHPVRVRTHRETITEIMEELRFKKQQIDRFFKSLCQ